MGRGGGGDGGGGEGDHSNGTMEKNSAKPRDLNHKATHRFQPCH